MRVYRVYPRVERSILACLAARAGGASPAQLARELAGAALRSVVFRACSSLARRGVVEITDALVTGRRGRPARAIALPLPAAHPTMWPWPAAGDRIGRKRG